MWGLKQAQKMSKCVQVEWEDGLMASFNYLWLRDNSLKRPSLVHLDLNAKPEAINCSRNALNLVWPPFSATNYSSDFLRENVQFTHPLKVNTNSISFPAHSKLPLDTPQSSESILELAPLNGQICSVVQASPIDAHNVVGQLRWRGTAQEAGTIWPHMQKLPAVCAVESLNGRSAQLFVVDTARALALLFKRHPAQFEFLAQCMLEYSEGLFRSRHPVCQIKDGKIVPGVFNNVARSSSMIVEPVEKLYESLQKFGRICSETTHTIQLMPGQRLLVDNSKAMLGAPAQLNRELMLRCLV